MLLEAKRFFSLRTSFPKPVVIEAGERYYCVFPGNNPNDIMIYPGEEGLFSYLNLKGDDATAESFTNYYRQKAIQIINENNKITCLEWVPGQIPKPLGECSFLVPIFEKLYERCFLDEPLPTILPIQTYKDDIKIHRLKKLERLNHTWEALQFFSPLKVWDNRLDNEIFLTVTLMVDTLDGSVAFEDIAPSNKRVQSSICHVLGDRFIEHNCLPERILVEDNYLLGQLLDFCSQLQIKCTVGSISTAQKVLSNGFFV